MFWTKLSGWGTRRLFLVLMREMKSPSQVIKFKFLFVDVPKISLALDEPELGYGRL